MSHPSVRILEAVAADAEVAAVHATMVHTTATLNTDMHHAAGEAFIPACVERGEAAWHRAGVECVFRAVIITDGRIRVAHIAEIVTFAVEAAVAYSERLFMA